MTPKTTTSAMNINPSAQNQRDQVQGTEKRSTEDSLTRSPPSLIHSTSVSSQASFPQPHTPPRGRLSRYPSNLGRVPLHRRGTSKTYETLEDLLREAGYKETRIFTPEGEHDAESANADTSDNKRSSMRDVVDFLAGLMPGAVSRNSSLHRPAPSQEIVPQTSDDQPGRQLDPPQLRVERVQSDAHTATPTQSHRRPKKRTAQGTSTSSTFTATSSTDSVHLMPPLPHHATSNTVRPRRSPHPARPPLPPTPSTASLLTILHKHSNSHQPQAETRPHLHHMASAPNMHPQARQHSSILNGSDADTDAPPLPRTWLENVARAVLFGGPGTHAGGPGTTSPGRAAHLARPLPRARNRASALSKVYNNGYASDQTSLPSASSLAPPPLCVRVKTSRAEAMLGTVTRTAVVCRSAPGSRAGSRVRGAAATDGSLWRKGVADGREKRPRGREEPKRQQERERGRGRPRNDGVPSLTRTRAEGDIWSRTSGRSADKSRGEEEGEGDDEDEDDDDDGNSSLEDELDLARMLVPPKRQHSIKSLRRHLQQPHDKVSRGGLSFAAGSAATAVWDDREDEDEDWWSGDGWHRKRRTSAFDDEEYYPVAGLWSAGEGSGAGKRRRGIPAVWAQLAGLGT